MNQNELSKIYKTKVQPSIDYVLSIWGNCNEYSKNMIFRLQKRAARIVTGNFDFIYVRGQDIMNELGWQTLEQRKKQYVSSLMFKSMHGLNPHCINNNILMACENHDRNTRFANNMNVVVSKPSVETFRNSLCTKVPFHGTVCHLTLNMLPPMIVLKECIRKSIYMHPHTFIVQHDHI